MDVSPRSYRSSDREALLELSRRALAREEEQVGTPLWATAEELDAELAGLDNAPEETLRVIDDEGEPVGFGGLEIEDEATLFGPLVSPRFRGRKFGATLLAASVELARSRGLESLLAGVGVHNIRGRLLLERAGFEPRAWLAAVYRLLPESHRAVEHPHARVTTRLAGEQDVGTVLTLCHECFTSGGLTDTAWQRGVERGQVRLAEENGAPVALVRINPALRRVFHGVTAGARARGLGGYVLSEALEGYWHEHPGQPLRLTVPVDNLAASRLYRRQGFVPWVVLQRFELKL